MATLLRLLGAARVAAALIAALPIAVMLAAAALASAGIAQRPAQIPAQRAQKTRPIAGQVLSADGSPAAGAEVCLRWRAHPELPVPFGHSLLPAGKGGTAVGQGVLRTTTNQKGRFRFQPPHRGPFLLIAFDEQRRHGSPRTFPVMPGSYHRLRLEPNFFMAGRVVDGNGVAMSGSQVRLAPTSLQWERAGYYNEPERRSETVTDQRGTFRLLFEHGYLRAPRWDILSVPLAVKGTVSSCAQMEPLRPVRSARDLTLTLGNTPATAGKVTDTRGKPIADALVWDPQLPGASTATGADGRYALPAFSGSVWVRADGRMPLRLTGANQDASLSPGMTLKVRILDRRGPLAGARVLWVLPQTYAMSPEWTDTTGDRGDVEVHGLPAGPLLGFVEVDGRFRRFFGDDLRGNAEREVQLSDGVAVHGQVVSKDDLPLAGVRVALWPQLDAKIVTPYVTYTDHGGRFAFDPVTGPHSLAVDAGRHGGTSLSVAEGDLGNDHVLKLPDTEGLSGQVLDADGKPAAGAWVTASRTIPADGKHAPALRRTMQAFCMMADEQGRFTFTGLPADATWSVVGAFMRDDVKYNARATVKTGDKAVSLRVAIEQQ